MLINHDFYNQMIKIVHSLGLHESNKTPCGQPLSISEAHAIMELQLSEEVTQTDISHLLQLEKSTISRLVQQMESKGWILRKTSLTDQRIKVLTLSEKGLAIANKLNISRTEKFNRILSCIPEGKQHEVIFAMEILTKAIYKDKEKEGS